jgi:protein-S-isoprenylcysteine O-methyltransferase Ste14
MMLTVWGTLALAYALASRLAYVVGVGTALRRQERGGFAGGFPHFRRIAAALMANDGASFLLLCFATRQTLDVAVSNVAMIGAGSALVILGLGVKLWARATLGTDAYYWHNFFEPPPPETPAPPATSGPYRFLKNPMYSVGNVHLYGLALIAASAPALAAAVFAHVAILAFYQVVERPHFERITGQRPAA